MVGGQGGRINIQYEGTGFLYHMVRILTGTLLEVGMGTRRIESVTIALEAKDRTKAGFLARQEDYSLTKSIIRRSPGRRNRLKLISWNVNGIRACVQKGFLDFFHEADADIFCIQETKMQEGQLNLELERYHQYWNYAVKKGYSGTAVFTKKNHYRYPMDWGLKSMTRRDA